MSKINRILKFRPSLSAMTLILAGVAPQLAGADVTTAREVIGELRSTFGNRAMFAGRSPEGRPCQGILHGPNPDELHDTYSMEIDHNDGLPRTHTGLVADDASGRTYNSILSFDKTENSIHIRWYTYGYGFTGPTTDDVEILFEKKGEKNVVTSIEIIRPDDTWGYWSPKHLICRI